jgi:hypothetical protein
MTIARREILKYSPDFRLSGRVEPRPTATEQEPQVLARP